MYLRQVIFLTAAYLLVCCKQQNETRNTVESPLRFHQATDLLLVQYDCKTDVDDLHSVAAFRTLIADPDYSNIKYHAVAGTYGVQEGLYVPPNALFEQAFGDNWTDANIDRAAALEKVKNLVMPFLASDGDIWIAEAGQSDFTASLIKALQSELPALDIHERIHVVQHSDWNEEVTADEDLSLVKQESDYHKISDGNVVGNGTPGFRTSEYKIEQLSVRNPELKLVWQTAIGLCNRYNGQEGRYNNEAIASGGFDFSDLSEVCWILNLENIKDAEQFFRRFNHE